MRKPRRICVHPACMSQSLKTVIVFTGLHLSQSLVTCVAPGGGCIASPPLVSRRRIDCWRLQWALNPAPSSRGAGGPSYVGAIWRPTGLAPVNHTCGTRVCRRCCPPVAPFRSQAKSKVLPSFLPSFPRPFLPSFLLSFLPSSFFPSFLPSFLAPPSRPFFFPHFSLLFSFLPSFLPPSLPPFLPVLVDIATTLVSGTASYSSLSSSPQVYLPSLTSFLPYFFLCYPSLLP